MAIAYRKWQGNCSQFIIYNLIKIARSIILSYTPMVTLFWTIIKFARVTDTFLLIATDKNTTCKGGNSMYYVIMIILCLEWFELNLKFNKIFLYILRLNFCPPTNMILQRRTLSTVQLYCRKWEIWATISYQTDLKHLLDSGSFTNFQSLYFLADFTIFEMCVDLEPRVGT